LASVVTETRLSELDAATAGKMANQVDVIQTDTSTDIPAQITALNDIAATDIVSSGPITTLSGSVVNVDTVDTCTTNTDMRGTDGANTTAPDNTSITAILNDTNELQTDWTNGGRLDLLLDAIQVEIEKLTTTAHSEPTGVPAANEAPINKIGYLFMALRNKVDVTATKKTFYDDSGTGEWSKALSDDGTTYSEAEGNTP